MARSNSRIAPDFVMLSFFDGLGTAFLVCDNYCKEHDLQWLGASWEIDKDLASLVTEHFPRVVPRGDFDLEDAHYDQAVGR